jgi:hypothetical protein
MSILEVYAQQAVDSVKRYYNLEVKAPPSQSGNYTGIGAAFIIIMTALYFHGLLFYSCKRRIYKLAGLKTSSDSILNHVRPFQDSSLNPVKRLVHGIIVSLHDLQAVDPVDIADYSVTVEDCSVRQSMDIKKVMGQQGGEAVVEVSFTSFAPLAFYKLRQAYGISEASFIKSIGSIKVESLKLGQGKSGKFAQYFFCCFRL